jgi:hypothetical protein
VPDWSSTSGDLGIFVDQSAEPIATSQANVGLGRRPWQWSKWCCVLQGAVGAVLVEMRRVFGQSGGRRGGDGCVRRGQALAAAQFVQLTSLSMLELPDTELPAHQRTMIEATETTLARLNADIVLTHSINDVHQDHQAVYQATVRAARNHPAILSYESPSVTEQVTPAGLSISTSTSTSRPPLSWRIGIRRARPTYPRSVCGR